MTYQHKQLHYEVIGEGPAILLVHGFGEDSSIWRHQREAFPGFKLILPDLPGSGSSEMIEDMSMEGLSASLIAILDQEKIQECILIGHSMGGYVALAFAEKFQNRLKGLGLFHSTAFADSETKKETRLKGIEFIKEHGAFAFLRTSTPNLFSPLSKEAHKELIEDQVQRSAFFTDAALIRYYESMIRRPDRSNLLKTITLPVLFVMGRFDTAVPLQDSLLQCYLPTQSFAHILEESGHMGMLEQTKETNLFLRNYIYYIHKS
ncbi:MAG TPA: alpha/beta hydrolase [Flavisolibacter sp.]|nr:alpha/beta hydrolase [Flavisolibacter sp.]